MRESHTWMDWKVASSLFCAMSQSSESLSQSSESLRHLIDAKNEEKRSVYLRGKENRKQAWHRSVSGCVLWDTFACIWACHSLRLAFSILQTKVQLTGCCGGRNEELDRDIWGWINRCTIRWIDMPDYGRMDRQTLAKKCYKEETSFFVCARACAFHADQTSSILNHWCM